MRYYTLLSIFLTMQMSVFSQSYHKDVFPELEDNSLITALKEVYKTTRVLSYNKARDTFMRNIDLQDGFLECLYSGYKVFIPPGVDPTKAAYEQGVNTEHLVPRSKGATEHSLAFSDMHNLFPAREYINTLRSSLPLGEIPDVETEQWLKDDVVMTSIPSSDIDSYTEAIKGERVEPRERMKGNVARSMFYFYTMYGDQVDNAAPGYFDIQKSDLCEWHFADPVDSIEWQRNIGIARYQDDKLNPFVLDCRLARLYCPEIKGACTSVNVDDLEEDVLNVFPNPFYGHLTSLTEASGTLKVYSMSGEMLKTLSLDIGMNHVQLDEVPAGLYLLVFQAGNQKYTRLIEKR